MQQRQPGQQFGIDPVVLGVLGVVLAQVRGLGGRDHHHPCAATAKPLRDHDPCVTGWLDDYRQLTWIDEVEITPEPLQIGRSGPELPAPPHRDAVVGERGLMRRPARPRRCLTSTPSRCSCHSDRNPDHQVTDHRGTAQTFPKQESTPIGWLQVPEQGHRSTRHQARGRPLRTQRSPRVPVGRSARPRTHSKAKCRRRSLRSGL